MCCFNVTIPNDSIAVKRPVPAKKQSRPIALIGATIHTVSGETIENGILTFKEGRIGNRQQRISIAVRIRGALIAKANIFIPDYSAHQRRLV